MNQWETGQPSLMVANSPEAAFSDSREASLAKKD